MSYPYQDGRASHNVCRLGISLAHGRQDNHTIYVTFNGADLQNTIQTTNKDAFQGNFNALVVGLNN